MAIANPSASSRIFHKPPWTVQGFSVFFWFSPWFSQWSHLSLLAVPFFAACRQVAGYQDPACQAFAWGHWRRGLVDDVEISPAGTALRWSAKWKKVEVGWPFLFFGILQVLKLLLLTNYHELQLVHLINYHEVSWSIIKYHQVSSFLRIPIKSN